MPGSVTNWERRENLRGGEKERAGGEGEGRGGDSGEDRKKRGIEGRGREEE